MVVTIHSLGGTLRYAIYWLAIAHLILVGCREDPAKVAMTPVEAEGHQPVISRTDGLRFHFTPLTEKKYQVTFDYEAAWLDHPRAPVPVEKNGVIHCYAAEWIPENLVGNSLVAYGNLQLDQDDITPQVACKIQDGVLSGYVEANSWRYNKTFGGISVSTTTLKPFDKSLQPHMGLCELTLDVENRLGILKSESNLNSFTYLFIPCGETNMDVQAPDPQTVMELYYLANMRLRYVPRDRSTE